MQHRKPGLLAGPPFEKSAVAVWTHVPGTPFTLPGSPEIKERLPGMVDWAPREMITRIARGLRAGKGPEDLAKAEGMKGLPLTAGGGALAGGTLGAMAGRLIGGQATTQPFKNLWSQGLSRGSLKQLSKIPMSAKMAPLLGLGIGAGVGALKWLKDAPGKRQQAFDVSRGLLAEKVLQEKALGEAKASDQPYTGGLLNNFGSTTATAPIPHVMRYGHLG